MSSDGSLQETIREFERYKDCTSLLYKRTSSCFEDILKSINIEIEAEDDNLKDIPFCQLEEVERELQKIPAVFFIGESNCGKSSIINELLRKSSLPVNQTPCTARIVRIKYSTKPYARLVGLDGKIKEGYSPEKKKLEKLVVVSDEDRDSEDALNLTVEVGLDHQLLGSGIELIDSPGKSESDVLDKVLDEYLEKGTVPLFVYVINGCNNLRPADKQTLRFLKDKNPQSCIIYVCNKVDITEEARSHDYEDDDDDDDDDDDEEDDDDDSKSKEEKVFDQLTEEGLVSGDCWKSCPLFHAISAKLVRAERRNGNLTEATERFRRFESHLKLHLGDIVKTQTRKVVQKLMVLQESFVNVVQVQKTLVTKQAGTLPDILRKGYEIEAKMCGALSLLTFHSDQSKNKIAENVKRLKEEFMRDADEYKPARLRDLRREAQAMMKNDLAPLVNELPLPKNNDLLLERFLLDMKGSILEKTCNSLAICVEEAMRELVKELTMAVIDFNEDLAHPIISRILEESYDIQFLAVKAETDELLKVVLNGLLDSIKEAASIALRKEISEPLSTMHSPGVSKKDVRDKATRRSIVQALLGTIDENRVAEAVHQACFCRLRAMHDLFDAAMNSFQTLQTSFANCRIASQLERFRVDFTPRIRTLAVEGKALHDMQNRGPAELGPRIAKTRLGDIYDCVSEKWCRASPNGQCVVKVLEKRRLSEDIWNQTAVDLVNMMDMIQKLRGSHRNLLRLFGWVFHEPGVLHVVMEKAKIGLIQALRNGLPEMIRMNIAVDVAEGLKAIHDVNYTYEDLKPGNVLLMHDGTAKINLAKPEFPYELTPIGEPFHISLEMYRYHGKGNLGFSSYDIYAYGMLLWVLCEGSGNARPAVYENLNRNEMQEAVERGVLPERELTQGLMADACWELMTICWKERGNISMDLVVANVKEVQQRFGVALLAM
ncbi:dual serine/threonine and tyrosine protein kinase-like [Montipora capricornis]|uniref:dual serine/threonine and tyrosine protein kinase-like n=1 Tax=Montipora capricornis TaxID=246305 RepID=UPI0035F10960